MKTYERIPNTYLGKSAVVNKKTIKDEYETHWHSFYEIEFINRGECVFTINGKPYEGKAGDAFMFNLSDFHSIQPTTGELELYTFQFTIDYIDDALLSFMMNNEKKKLSFPKESFGNITYLLDLLDEECKNARSFQPQYAKSLLNAISVVVCRQIEKTAKTPTELANSTLKLASNYMQLNFQDTITISEIAEYAGVSPSYISRLFRKHMDTSPKGYLSGLRLNYSAKMLEFSDYPITEICYKSGFGDFSAFWRAFNAKYGCSPREYRAAKSHKEDFPYP